MNRYLSALAIVILLAFGVYFHHHHKDPSLTGPAITNAAHATILPTATAADAAGDWGTIKGQVVWAAEIPARPPLNVNKDEKHCLEKGPILGEEFVINKENKGVKWVLVWLAQDPSVGKKPLPIHPSLEKIAQPQVVLDQPCCAFIPHVMGMRVGQDLVVKNSAPVAHNVNYAGNPLTNPGGNQLLPPGGMITVQGLKAERLPLRISCNIHPWMSAKIGVFEHPYFAVTDADGKFEIKDAPAGNYRLIAWQEGVGWRGGAEGRSGEKITIKPGVVTDLGKLDLKPSE